MPGHNKKKRLNVLFAIFLVLNLLAAAVPGAGTSGARASRTFFEIDMDGTDALETEMDELRTESVAGFHPGRVNIKLKRPLSPPGSFALLGAGLDYEKHGIRDLEPLFPGSQQRSRALFSENADGRALTGWYRANLQEGVDPLAAAEGLKKDPAVSAAEPDYLRSISEFIIPDRSTDPRIREQWHLEHAGIKDAWEYLQSQGIPPGGNREIIVAVIDSGVDYSHPDLQGNMWINTAETVNGHDDDGNGYIDDIHGANFVDGSGDPRDDHGHGTHVAGVVAALAGNNEGGAGVAFNVQIMALKAAQPDGILTSSDVARAIQYAVEKDADIINMSFGGYDRSTLEEDALQLAFARAVLVAAAGNDGMPNQSLPMIPGEAVYPAAYNRVLGVMAQNSTTDSRGDHLADFSNWDAFARNALEYELMAPGVKILSTALDGKYAKMSGTSMATPVVAGAAALVRSKYSDKDTYPPGFIMGQLTSTGDLLQGKTYSLWDPPGLYRSLNVYRALTELPQPDISFLEHYILDGQALDPQNNNNGLVDAGETIHLGLVLRNHWSKAEDVEVSIDTLSPENIPDPYVELLNAQDALAFGDIGSFGVKDNGLIYDDAGEEVVGVSNPIIFKVADEIPGDHLITFNLNITARNGLAAGDETIYASRSTFGLTVRKGENFPRVISTDMTLTRDDYWIIAEPTLIEAGVTVTAGPGTKIQFYSSDPGDPRAETEIPYLQVEGRFIAEGTAEEPVEIFPGRPYPGHQVVLSARHGISQTDSCLGLSGEGGSDDLSGYASLKYVKMLNPRIAVHEIDHCHFRQDLFTRTYLRYLEDDAIRIQEEHGPFVQADTIKNSIFQQLGYGEDDSSKFHLLGEAVNNLFDGCVLFFRNQQATNNVFLKNHKLISPGWGEPYYSVSRGEGWGLSVKLQEALQIVFPVNNPANGSAYFTLRPCLGSPGDISGYRYMHLVNEFARSAGGHIVTINDEEENEFLRDYYFQQVLNSTDFAAQYPDLDYSNFNVHPLTGLHNFQNEDSFAWINAEPALYTNWGEGEPDRPSGEGEPAGLAQLSVDDGRWHFVPGDRVDSYPFIIEISDFPGELEQAFLEARREAFLQDGFSTVANNAFLNFWNLSGTEHWMRFFGREEGKGCQQYLNGNYWGTSSRELIELAIVDDADESSRARVIYEPILFDPPETAYPFVTEVYLSADQEEKAPLVGAGTVTVHVFFNRNMDLSGQPRVSFGPAEPFTDHPIAGDWAGPRHWQGTAQITALTGDGQQFFRVAGAAAADDPWLVTGDDAGRFHFQIWTAGDDAFADECFIATAAFGSKLDPGVTILRQFRDAKLLTNDPGRAFVRCYCRLSPGIARYIAGSNPLKMLVRVLLLPVIAAAFLCMHPCWLLLLPGVFLLAPGIACCRRRGRGHQ